MTGLLACRLSGRIAAFAPVSGNFYPFAGGCQPPRPVPILDFHGARDTVLPYNGTPPGRNPAWPLPAIQDWLKGWASRDGCSPAPTIFLSSATVTGQQWSNCRANVAVVHYRIENGGHAWPPTIQGQSPEAIIWQFFQKYSLS